MKPSAAPAHASLAQTARKGRQRKRINDTPALKWRLPTIITLAFIATPAGLWPGNGPPYAMTNFHGEEVIISARGLYYWGTVSSVGKHG